ncbi:MAG: Clp protease ClpC [Bacteroidetes bacterium 4572_117]|nr:MAG: Clp protease ClpC [Bacteroidetes bacterium 4572_117]
MNPKFTNRIKKILSYSKEEAVRLGNKYIGTEHLFLGILREGEATVLDDLITLGIDLKSTKAEIEEKIRVDVPETVVEEDHSTGILKTAERALKLTELEAISFKDQKPDTQHLMLAILKDQTSLVTKVFNKYQVNYKILRERLIDIPHAEIPNEDEETSEEHENPKQKNLGKGRSQSDTPVLDNFGVDLTKSAESNQLDPVVGREMEIERLVQILSRRKKNNPVLIGEPGVGKSAIAEGLAIRIVKKQVSRVLFGKRIVTLDVASIVAGTKYRGQFEERMKSILNELSKTNEVILFIDEIHTIVGAGGASGSLDASNMLKPALARGELQCIGATTLDEYRQHIEKDGALERRFQKIMVDPTSMEETMEILHNIKDRYEDHHNVIYTDDAIKSCVKLTTRYISDRHLPDKAIDALDESGSRVHISKIKIPETIEKIEQQIEDINKEKLAAVKNQQFELAASHRDKEHDLLKELDKEKVKWEEDLSNNREVVDTNNVEEVVAMMTGVPVQRIAQSEGVRLLKMKGELSSKVIGQNEAIKKIVKAIQRNRAGLKDPKRPIGSFIFLGPTGVGKTQLAKILARYLFDSEEALVRVDMSEYMEKFSVSRLVGAPPGYVGYEEGGQLTEKVRRKPYSVVLLDEIEKAHPDVFHLLLHVLDEGQLTDSLGRKVDFKNTIIMMTSNIGSRQIQDFGRGVGFSTKEFDEDRNKDIIQKALKKAFAPEFLNRVDDVVLFNSLTIEDIHKIIDIELEGLYTRIEELGYKLIISKEAKDFIANKGYDSKFGARPLKRAIQKYLEDEMAEVIIEASITEGDAIEVNFNKKEEKIIIGIKKNENKPDTGEKQKNSGGEKKSES